MEINYKDVLDTDVSFLTDHYDNIGHILNAQKDYRKINVDSVGLDKLPSIEHYKLLTYLSYKFNGITIMDAGTHHGLSSVCLAQNKNNKVISYDIVKVDRFSKLTYQHTPIGDSYPNIEYIQSDINNVPNDIIKDCKLIFLDIIHDGKAEVLFSNKLKEMSYAGYILCDDVGLSGELRYPLGDWFGGLPWDKYDLTKVGHFSGSGLLDCVGDVTIIDNII